MQRLAALAVILAACRGGSSPMADAYVDVARDDLVGKVGSDATLDVACWNLRVFPSSANAPRLVGDVITSLGLDVVAVEEIESEAALDAVVARMPGWEAALPSPPGSRSGGIGFFWRRDLGTPSFSLVAAQGFTRPVVRAVFPGSISLYAVHLKAGTGASDEQARIDQMTALEAVVRDAIDTTDERGLVLGDFNEDFDDQRSAEVFAPWTSRADHYSVLSKPVDDAGGVTFLPSSVMLDHMVASRALATSATAAPIIPRLDQNLAGYQMTVSDHLPLVITLTQ